MTRKKRLTLRAANKAAARKEEKRQAYREGRLMKLPRTYRCRFCDDWKPMAQ